MDHAKGARPGRKCIESILAERGIQPTRQRVRVAELLFSCDQHLTAEQVIQALGRDGCHVSKATVYNTLNLFAERGLLNSLALNRDCGLFDSNTAPHHHIHVEGTGELIDVPPGAVEFSRLPPLPPGTEQVAVEVVIRVRRPG
ncbi:MAG TPA: Fur family transcriptional regulator [Steroidobacteraceae bacterium]|jgi:Fur family iron response transcriptional regulator